MKITRDARLVFLLMNVIFLSNVSRLIFSPLLVSIMSDLGFSQSRAAGLFLIIALGYSPGMLFSGYLAARIRHRGTILCSLIFEAAGLFLTAISGTFALSS
jgi:NNP family nitrate/nitrite transporter-like MFS transporter